MNEIDDDIINTVQRWESIGVLEGLPPYEKQELAIIYDNITRCHLYEPNTPKNKEEILSEVIYLITRRIYRRVGSNFDVINLYKKIREHVLNHDINTDSTDGKNPIIEFSISFADSYEDEITNINVFGAEKYQNRINKLTELLNTILNNDRIVSYVDRINDSEWSIKYSDLVRSKQEIRLRNQKTGLEVMNKILKETNKGI